jgi:hypothetical protein
MPLHFSRQKCIAMLRLTVVLISVEYLLPYNNVDAQQTNLNATICSAVGDVLYKTEWERQHNPCSSQCDYDSTSRQLIAECRYEYCTSCSNQNNVCGIRVIQINHTFTEESLYSFLEQQSKLNIGSTKKYCIDYTDEERGGKFICIDIDDSFNTNCNEQYTDLLYGLPLLSCDESFGCRCKNQATTKTDISSPFIGFEQIPFDSCYVNDTTASTITSKPTSSSTQSFASLAVAMVTFLATLLSFS